MQYLSVLGALIVSWQLLFLPNPFVGKFLLDGLDFAKFAFHWAGVTWYSELRQVFKSENNHPLNIVKYLLKLWNLFGINLIMELISLLWHISITKLGFNIDRTELCSQSWVLAGGKCRKMSSSVFPKPNFRPESQGCTPEDAVRGCNSGWAALQGPGSLECLRH